MPFDQQHENIDLSQKRLAELEPVQVYKDLWSDKVNATQKFCNEKAQLLNDDTVLEEGLAKIAQILALTAFEGAKETGNGVVLRNLMIGLEKKIAKIEEDFETAQLYEAAAELLDPQSGAQSSTAAEHAKTTDTSVYPTLQEDRMYGFAETPTRDEFQELVDGMQSTDEKRAFIESVMDTISENQEAEVQITEKQSMRLEQLQLFSMLMQMIVARVQKNEDLGIGTKGSVDRFKELISDEKLKNYQYQILLNPNASLEDLIPDEAFILIERWTSPDVNLKEREGLFTVAFRDPANRTELHEKKLNILNWFRFYSHYGEVSSIIEDDLRAEIEAAKGKISAEKMAELHAETKSEMQELKDENIDRWRTGYQEKNGQWVPAMTEQQIANFITKMSEQTLEHKTKAYALHYEFDPNLLSPKKRELWEIYNDTFDPKEQTFNLQDSTWDTIKKELAINLPLIMISGGVGSLVKAGISKAALWTAGRMGILTGLEIAYEGSRIIRAGVTVGLTLAEGVTFEAAHSFLARAIGVEEKWLAELNLPEAMQRIFWSTVTLGLFHGVGKLGEGIGKEVDSVLARQLKMMSEDVANMGSKKLIQQVLINGNLEAATILLMGAIQTGIYEGNVEAAWNSLTSSDALFHAYLSAYALKAGHMGAETFKPITGRAVRRSAERSATRKFEKGEVYITSRGQAEVVAIDPKTGEMQIRFGEGETASTETVGKDTMQGMVEAGLRGEKQAATQAPKRREKPSPERVRDNSGQWEISDDAAFARAEEILGRSVTPGEKAAIKKAHEMFGPNDPKTAEQYLDELLPDIGATSKESMLAQHRKQKAENPDQYSVLEVLLKARKAQQEGLDGRDAKTLVDNGILGREVALRLSQAVPTTITGAYVRGEEVMYPVGNTSTRMTVDRTVIVNGREAYVLNYRWTDGRTYSTTVDRQYLDYYNTNARRGSFVEIPGQGVCEVIGISAQSPDFLVVSFGQAGGFTMIPRTALQQARPPERIPQQLYPQLPYATQTRPVLYPPGQNVYIPRSDGTVSLGTIQGIHFHQRTGDPLYEVTFAKDGRSGSNILTEAEINSAVERVRVNPASLRGVDGSLSVLQPGQQITMGGREYSVSRYDPKTKKYTLQDRQSRSLLTFDAEAVHGMLREAAEPAQARQAQPEAPVENWDHIQIPALAQGVIIRTVDGREMTFMRYTPESDTFTLSDRSQSGELMNFSSRDMRELFGRGAEVKTSRQAEALARPRRAPREGVGRTVIGEADFSFMEGGLHLRTPDGVEAFMGSDKGIGYKDHNEDRVAYNPETGFFSVVDGVGGHAGGQEAARILAEELSSGNRSVRDAANRALDRMMADPVLSTSGGGAVFASARVRMEGGVRKAEVCWAGDAEVFVLRASGAVERVTVPDNYVTLTKNRTEWEGLSEYQRSKATPERKREAQSRTEWEAMTPDMRAMTEGLSTVTNLVGGRYDPNNPHRIHTTEVTLGPGDKLLLGTDGITKNLPEDLGQRTAGMGVHETAQAIEADSTAKMSDSAGKWSHDNRGGIVLGGW